MDTELFELCKEVFKRTEWDDDGNLDSINKKGEIFRRDAAWLYSDNWQPIYTSDYLLENLPPVILDPNDNIFKVLTMWINGDKSTHAGYAEPYAHDDKFAYSQQSDEMRKTLLKLVIALDDAKEIK